MRLTCKNNSVHSPSDHLHAIPFSIIKWQQPDFYQLTELVKKVSLEVVQGGGIVRGIHNHGIRDLVRF
jgi:hypothetical protein